MSVLEINAVVDLLVTLWPHDTWTHVHGLLADWRERLDGKDQYSGHHSALASEYAIQLANRQDLPFDKIAALWVAGHVYDLGKIAVPEHVLVKPGPLSNAGTQFDPYLVRSFVSLVRVNQLTGRGPAVPRSLGEAS